MTKQITPIDIYNSTWGDALDRVNELIDAANTEFVTIGGVNEGNVSITGTLEANNLGIDNFQANTATAAVVHAGTLDANTIAANTLTVNVATITNANVSANVSANVVGGNYVVANTILAGATYDANGALVNANTLINKDNIATPVLAANIVQVTGTLLVEHIGQNFTANVATFSRVNSNTVDAGTVNANTIRVNNKDNLQKISLVDYLPSRVLGTDANTNIIQYAISVFGQSILSSPNAANTRALIGLDQINNTSDAAKPISVATQAALDLKTDKATRVNVGPGLAGGGALAANVTISLSANTIASLAKADSAVQGNSAALVPSGGVFGQVLMKQSTDPYDYAWTTSAITTAVQFVPQSLTPEQQAQGRENLGLGTALSDYVRRDGGSQITGELRTTSQNGLRIQHNASNTSLMLRYDGTDGYLLFANSTTGAFSTQRPIRINYASGAVTFGHGINVTGSIRGNSATNVTDGIASFYADSEGGSYKNIPNRRSPLKVQTTTINNTYAPVLNASYDTSAWNGFWSQGVINTGNNNQQTSYQLIHTHADYSGRHFWTFNGIDGNFTSAILSASQNIYIGGAQIASDGNIRGTRWNGQWLYDYLNSTAMRAYPRRNDGGTLNFNWSGQGGQPTWLWGGTDGVNMYVYNPSNFSVNYASSCWNSERLQGWDIPGIQNDAQNRANDRGYWRTRDYLLAEHVPVGGYIFAQSVDAVDPGGTVGGDKLTFASANGASGNRINWGTWQACGTVKEGGTAIWKPECTTLWKRIG